MKDQPITVEYAQEFYTIPREDSKIMELEFICNKKIANNPYAFYSEEVKLEDMIWAEKLAKESYTARDWLNKSTSSSISTSRKNR
jgi:hypothetical protein